MWEEEVGAGGGRWAEVHRWWREVCERDECVECVGGGGGC